MDFEGVSRPTAVGLPASVSADECHGVYTVTSHCRYAPCYFSSDFSVIVSLILSIPCTPSSPCRVQSVITYHQYFTGFIAHDRRVVIPLFPRSGVNWWDKEPKGRGEERDSVSDMMAQGRRKGRVRCTQLLFSSDLTVLCSASNMLIHHAARVRTQTRSQSL